MKLFYKDLLPKNFSEGSRVWIYQSNRLFSISEAIEIESLLEKFTANWTSHGDGVMGYGNLFFGQFIILIADESHCLVSGCSTDSSVRFMKNLGEHFGVDFFNRTNLAFFKNDKVEVLPLGQLQYAFDNGFIDRETLYFNNLVQNKKELETKWIVPVKDSWLHTRLSVF